MKTYKMTIAGLERELEIFPINDKISIAAFILFGDAEITVAAAEELLKKVPEFDYIITPEAKSIPLAYEMSRQSGKKYFVARKGPKLYMADPISVSVKSITTEKEQRLYLGKQDADEIRGKRVLIVDDVISTGESLVAVRELCNAAGAVEAAACAVLAEGDSKDRDDIIYLEPLPLIIND
ncbi:MAG: adenine phosphoribosyltransferase [Clostridia bacterium]|nr:adenine phosphoribosyltransferase [Clostridia bacterium]MEE1024380.1 phosphoribosyltransferase family protein [Acutalibacteraceae bacterium]